MWPAPKHSIVQRSLPYSYLLLKACKILRKCLRQADTWRPMWRGLERDQTKHCCPALITLCKGSGFCFVSSKRGLENCRLIVQLRWVHNCDLRSPSVLSISQCPTLDSSAPLITNRNTVCTIPSMLPWPVTTLRLQGSDTRLFKLRNLNTRLPETTNGA